MIYVYVSIPTYVYSIIEDVKGSFVWEISRYILNMYVCIFTHRRLQVYNDIKAAAGKTNLQFCLEYTNKIAKWLQKKRKYIQKKF